MPYYEIHQKCDDKQVLKDILYTHFKRYTRKITFICECFGHEYRVELERAFDFYARRTYKDGVRLIDQSKLGYINAREMIMQHIGSPNTNNITIKIVNDEELD